MSNKSAHHLHSVRPLPAAEAGPCYGVVFISVWQGQNPMPPTRLRLAILRAPEANPGGGKDAQQQRRN